MIVFKNYLKIAKTYIPFIALYTVIFLAFAVLATTNNKSMTYFESKKTDIAIINNDKETEFIKGFINFIKENSNIKEIGNEEEKLKDALFFRDVDYIITIPEGFTENLLSGKDIKLKTMKVADGINATYQEMLLNKYLNTARIYIKYNYSEKELTEAIKKDLEQSSTIKLNNEKSKTKLEQAVYYYNFTNYIFLSFMIIVIGMIMSSYNEKTKRKRNLISPISYKKLNLYLLIGNFVMTIIVWIFYVLISIVLYGKDMLSINGILLMINSFAFTITCLSIGFLIGSLVKNQQVISSISNVVALGTSFICGAFVPQQLLGSTVLNIGKIFPSYWFIKNNNEIIKLETFTIDKLKPIIGNIIIVIGFAILMYIITLIASKYKQKQN